MRKGIFSKIFFAGKTAAEKRGFQAAEAMALDAVCIAGIPAVRAVVDRLQIIGGIAVLCQKGGAAGPAVGQITLQRRGKRCPADAAAADLGIEVGDRAFQRTESRDRGPDFGEAVLGDMTVAFPYLIIMPHEAVILGVEKSHQRDPFRS